MKRKKGKAQKRRKYFTLMLIPHNSGRVKTLKTTHPVLKLFLLATFFVSVIMALIYQLMLIKEENLRLRKEYSALNLFLTEQQKLAIQNLSVISEIEKLEKISQEKIEEFHYQIQNLVKNYIDKETKTLAINRSAIASNPAISFAGKISELKALLKFLEDADKEEDKLFSELAEKKFELENYLNSLPTIWPTEGFIESGFGNRLHPIYKKYHFHTGVDIAGEIGNPIYAAASGTVIAVGKNGGYGYMVDIDHGNGLVTRYAHCSKILVKKWQKVKAGEKIAEVGDTGVTTGPHLHFEILLNGEPIDPVIFIGTEQN
ncbi:peptidase M23 [Thermoclostridium stercorarium subsp. leptospartum DSM 9219]|uniref:Peptidase M23 n=1 Tax=Thermoclostridium stercorarium subsp. leptospartum DSM 9219 TaxID=1346611 RepID=A0A1B1YMA9_THEST|nr:M23 family metallopeptidase [Thermoclostridium stercorarium]ANX01901.1 peptidase M23 [Thermoclostridium stercorarium subsp. leptospartum DSM 9219]